MKLGNTFQMLQKHHPRGFAQCPGRIHPRTLALPPGKKSSSCSQHLWPRVLLILSNEKHNTSLNPGEQGAFSFSCSCKFQPPSLTPEHEATHTMKLSCLLALCLTLCLVGLASSGKTSGELRGWEQGPQDRRLRGAGMMDPTHHLVISPSGGDKDLDTGRGSLWSHPVSGKSGARPPRCLLVTSPPNFNFS